MKSPKLVKLVENYLAGPPSQSINDSIKKGLFPENAKVASVTNIRDNKTYDKKSVLIFCPISILNCFSEVYKNIIKIQFVEKMGNLFTPFISTYWESFNTTCAYKT